jgi:hypothetical protein
MVPWHTLDFANFKKSQLFRHVEQLFYFLFHLYHIIPDCCLSGITDTRDYIIVHYIKSMGIKYLCINGRKTRGSMG